MPRRGPRLARKARVLSRRALRRLSRSTPEWLLWLTPWEISLALHGLFLLILALLVFAGSGRSDRGTHFDSTLNAQQLRDDLTSLQVSDHSGDPLTTLHTPEPPSLPDPRVLDVRPSNLPDLTDRAVVDRGLDLDGSGIALKDGAVRKNTPSLTLARPDDLVAPFSGRQAAARSRLVRREGGTVESERAVERGLDWLSRHQRADGGWSLDHKPQCRTGRGCPEGPHADSDVAATGLALLPMLGAGQTQTEKGRFQDNVRRGLDWLLKVQKPDGDLFTGGGGNTHMYSHAIATMALCEAFGLTGEERLRGPAQRAIGFLIKAQAADGGWRYNPGEPGDTSVFGWQMLALRSAQLASLKVPPETIKGAQRYLDAAATDGPRSHYAYQPGGGPTPTMTAEALLIRQYLGWTLKEPGLRAGVDFLAKNLAESKERNIYYWYYATQVLHNAQGPEWKAWNPRVRDGLVGLQNSSTHCDRGSWDPTVPRPDVWGIQAGRHFTTCLSLLTLEVYYRYLPLYRENDRKSFSAKDFSPP